MARTLQEQPKIHKSGFDFLQKLKKNNHRDWFNTNKATYQKELELVEQFAEALLRELSKHDEIETLSGKKKPAPHLPRYPFQQR